jgi:hypothetical protein
VSLAGEPTRGRAEAGEPPVSQAGEPACGQAEAREPPVSRAGRPARGQAEASEPRGSSTADWMRSAIRSGVKPTSAWRSAGAPWVT